MNRAAEDESAEDAERPSRGPELPQWVRITTHLVALGWASVEIGVLGARLNSLSFITLVLLADHGPRTVLRLRKALAAT